MDLQCYPVDAHRIVAMLLDNGLVNRLAGVQGVAEVDRPECLVSCNVFIQLSLPRIEFAILFARIVLRLMNYGRNGTTRL